MSSNKVKPHYIGHRARLLKRVLQHISYVEEYELLEILLTRAQPRKDLKNQAKHILQQSGSIRDMVHTPYSYDHIEGIGSSLSWYCSFLIEIAKQYTNIESSNSALCNECDGNMDIELNGDVATCHYESQAISSFSQVRRYLEENNIYATQEKDYIIYVNDKKEIVAMESCSFLEENLTFITKTIKMKPAGVILVRKIAQEMYILRKEDVEMLKKREKALSIFGVVLLDYIICTSDSMISLQQYSLLER